MHLKSTLLSLLAPLALAQTPTLLELLQSQPDLSSLADAFIAVPEFAAAAANLTNVTILAPVNSAFEQLLAGGLTAESQAIETGDPDGISTLLAYHVMNGTYKSSSFTEIPTYYNTIFNQSYAIFGTVRTNVTAGQNLGLVLNGDNATILSGELQYSNVIEADIAIIPGITIHKIDSVLTIPLNLTDTLLRLSTVGVSAAFGAFETANLTLRTEVDGETSIETLDTTDDLTIFVPNNNAFASAASAFEGASVETLRDVLLYHAITGSVVFASDVTNTTFEAVSGDELTLSVIEGSVVVNQARVILPNILLSNGVMHIIDTVLNPNNTEVNREDIDPSASPSPAFSGATAVGTEVPFTATGLPPSTTISIPAIATTAEFVSDVSEATATTGSGSASQPAEFTGMAGRLEIGLQVALVGGAAAAFVL